MSDIREIAQQLAHPEWLLSENQEAWNKSGFHFAVHPESVIGRSMRLARAYLELEHKLEDPETR